MSCGPIVLGRFHRQGWSLGDSKGGPTSPFGVLSLRCYRVSRRNGRAPLRRRASAPSPHPLPRFSFTNPKHRFGFERKNEEADMEFSASAGNEMQRVHSDVGKKWGNKLAPRCVPHTTSSVTLRVPPSPQGEGFWSAAIFQNCKKPPGNCKPKLRQAVSRRLILCL